MKPRPFYLAVDMDDTLRMRDGWHTDVKDSAEGRPNHKVIALVKGLHAKGWRIILWTCRPITEGLKQWCKDHDVPIDFYNENPEAIEWFREQFGFIDILPRLKIVGFSASNEDCRFLLHKNRSHIF